MSECVLNETKIMVNGVFDKAAAIKLATEKSGVDAETAKVIILNFANVHNIMIEFLFVQTAIDFCEKEGQSKKVDFDEMAKLPGPPTDKVCNMISGYMIGCVYGQIFKNCPKDKYTADAECDKIKAFVDKCGCLHPIKPKA